LAHDARWSPWRQNKRTQRRRRATSVAIGGPVHNRNVVFVHLGTFSDHADPYVCVRCVFFYIGNRDCVIRDCVIHGVGING
jgi:hypothetical protein